LPHRLLTAHSYAALAAHAGEFLRSIDNASEVLLVAPSKGAADDLARRCLPSGALGVHRLTLHQLAAALATPRMVAKGMAPASRLGVEAIAARIAHALRKAGGIPYFAPVSATPGFARALAATLTELRLEAAGPAALSGAGEPGRDLAGLLDSYEQTLAETAIADLATLLRLATAAASEDRHRFAGLPMLLIDPPIDSVLSRELARALISRSSRVLAATLCGDEVRRDALAGMLGVPAEDVSPGAAGDLDRVRRFLFSPQAPASELLDGTVDYFSAPGESMECVEITRRLHKMAAAGFPFDRAAILLRDPERYQPFLEEAMRRAGIPAHFSRGVVRPDPAGRAFLALLACAREGCSATRFSEYLSLAQVPSPGEAEDAAPLPPDDELLAAFAGPVEPASPDEPPEPSADETSPVIGGTLQSPIGWETLLVDAAVIGGADRWERRLRGLEQELRLQLRELDGNSAAHTRLIDQIERLKNLQRFALPLIRRLHALPASAVWREWLVALHDLARAALRRPAAVLAVLSELQSMEEVGPVVLDEVFNVLSDRLRFLRREPDPRRYGSVYVASIEEARGRGFDVVFLPGLAEGLFPKKVMEDPLLLDVHRAQADSRLRTQTERVRQERLLLHRAVGAASGRLIFSYARVDVAQARPRVPSLYALEILRAALGRLPELRAFEKQAARGAQSRLDWPAPRAHADAIDDAEYDLVSIGQALERKERGSVRYLVEVNAALGRSLRARAHRWTSKWTYADGLVDPEAAVSAALQRDKLSARAYSPSSLQHYAACPYRFLLHAIHQLRPREAPVALEQMDPLTRGALFHSVQRDLFTELNAAGLLPLNREGLGAVRDAADRTLNRVASQYEEDLAPAIARVWASEVEEIRADLHGWLGQLASDGGGWLPAHFELAFGLGRDADRDPASLEAEAVTPGGARLRGSIDLVEKHTGRGTLRVIDHKTGKAPERPAAFVGGGTVLQPLLYALAAESVLGGQVECAQLFYCTQRGNYQRVEIPVNSSTRDRIARVLDVISTAIGEGFLPAAPQKDACGYCDYRCVCGPHEELRIQRKKGDRLDTLQDLRNMP
jgi:CRISPR/Cas system-associated exonuclease Cas4 (RecB family)